MMLACVILAGLIAVVAIYESEHRCVACGRRYPTLDERAYHERKTHQL